MGDWFTRTFGNAVGDIRDKLIFESFFDCKVPERSGMDHFSTSKENDQSPAERLGWDRAGETQEKSSPSPDHGIDR